MLSRLDSWFIRRSRPQILLIAVGLIALIGTVNVLEGRGISFDLFYLLPVGVAAWYAGFTSAMGVSAVAAIAWMGVDSLSGDDVAGQFISIWNTLLRFGLFVVVSRLLSHINSISRLRDAMLEERIAISVRERLARERAIAALKVSEQEFLSLFGERPSLPVHPDTELHSSSKLMEDLSDRIQATTATLAERTRQVLSFSSLASHELRTPLAIVRNQIEDILVPSVSEKKLREALASVYDQILVLTRIVNDLLSLSRALGGTLNLNLHEVEFYSFLQEFYEEAGMLARGKIISVVLARGPKVTVKIDPVTMRQVLFNLLDNSLKHTAEQGTIHLRHEVKDSQLVVHFSDNGVGIPPNDLERIFDPFFQGDLNQVSAGVGLGLSLVKSIVSAHGGELSVQSEVGKGTAFTIRLPISKSPAL